MRRGRRRLSWTMLLQKPERLARGKRFIDRFEKFSPSLPPFILERVG